MMTVWIIGVQNLAHADDEIIAEKNEGLIGEVRYSLLSEEKFQRLYGSAWVLMKGQELQKEDDLYREMEIRVLPDSRGVFLRCKNNGREDGKGNDQELKLGDYEADRIAKHSHGRNFVRYHSGQSGLHSHYIPFQNTKDTTIGPFPHEDDGVGLSTQTCPRSITVNAFIKIRRSNNDKYTDRVLSHIRQIPRDMTENRAFLDAIENFVDAAVEKKLKTLSDKK